MATFSQLQTAVSRRLLDATNQAVLVEDVAIAINDAISYWKYRRFWFNEYSTPITLTAKNNSLPIGADFLVPATDESLYISYSNSRYELKRISQAQYNRSYVSNGYGLPRGFALFQGSYKVYPVPDQAYIIDGGYLRQYAPLVNGTDTNDFTINATRLITLWACADLSGDFRQDDKMEGYFRGAALDQYKNLRVMTDKSNSTGSLTLHSIL